jgi:hypothetical protein
MNDDGIYSKNLLNEDECTEVIFHFMSNKKVDRFYKNNRTDCEFKKSALTYVVEGNQINFVVKGMKQKHKFEIANCKLIIYGVYDIGMTESGEQDISINSVFERE